ncbi:MAG TPA: hypothetical protein PLD47_12900 [Aggregatilineales bacterium]|nr:hypothetical protein [Anaerolineales bacterium]HRE48616.1 hypothetical protein [Aggregatilineales bacterium]
MPQLNPRIIVVDARQNLHQIVRAAMELMGRRPRLIETYTGDDALSELKISSPDILITAQGIAGTMNGAMVAITAKRELAALPIIVVADEDDPELDEEDRAGAMFAYLRRPFAPELFIRELRVALDGPEAVTKETKPEEIIPVPGLNDEPIKPVMLRLMRDVGAMAIVLADRNGKVLTYAGAAGYFDRDLLAEALAPGFGSTMKMLPIVGEQPRVLKFYEGERSVLFGLAVGLHHYLALVFEGNAPASALGNVKRYGFTAVNDMLKVIGQVAFDPRPSIPTPQAAPAEMPKRRRTMTQEVPAVRAEPPPPSRASDSREVRKHVEPERPPRRGRAAEPPAPEINMDMSLFDQLDQIDLDQADALFDPDRIGAEGLGNSDTISFDDAMLQGIIGDIED